MLIYLPDIIIDHFKEFFVNQLDHIAQPLKAIAKALGVKVKDLFDEIDDAESK